MHSILPLVDRIYATVSEPESWNMVLGNLVNTMGGIGTRMRILDKQGKCYNLIAGTGHDDSFDSEYARHFSRVDVWNPILSKSSTGELFHSEEIFPERVFRNTEIYNEFYRHYDMFYGLGGNIAKNDNIIARIGVHRSRAQGPFGEQEKRKLQALMPHFIRAFNLSNHFEELRLQVGGLQEALYQTTTPLLLINEFGKVIFLNKTAETLLGDGSGLFVRNNQIILASENEQAIIRQLLQQAVETGIGKGIGSGGAMRLTAKDGTQRYNLFITPYPDRPVAHLGMNKRICAAVFIHTTQELPVHCRQIS